MTEDRRAALANECLIAFGNLRASILATAHLLAEKNPKDLPIARDLVAEHLAHGLQLPSARADVGDLGARLAELCAKGEPLLKANRRRANEDETLALAARRLDADLCIARGVLGALPPRHAEHPPAADRESAPPDPARRTG
jgi:hypothetical protein